MRPGPATRAACFVEPSFDLDDGTGPTALPEEVPLLPVLGVRTASRKRFPVAYAAAGGPIRYKSGKWRRPQCPGNRRRLRVSEFPWQFTLENCQLPSASPQSSFDPFEKSHVFAEPTLVQNARTRNRKPITACAETVDEETSLWKTEENLE